MFLAVCVCRVISESVDVNMSTRVSVCECVWVTVSCGDVLHLVLSDSDITTAIDIALRLARLGQFTAIIEAIVKAENK